MIGAQYERGSVLYRPNPTLERLPNGAWRFVAGVIDRPSDRREIDAHPAIDALLAALLPLPAAPLAVHAAAIEAQRSWSSGRYGPALPLLEKLAGGGALTVSEKDTLGARARAHLRGLANSLGCDDLDTLEPALEAASESWRDQLLDDRPRWSGLTLDLTPFELSANFDVRGVELRFAAEAQADPASPEAYWQAAMRLNAVLSERFGASLGPFERVADLFQPRDEASLLAAWHAAGGGRSGRPSFKIYLSPSARGRGQERDTLGEACGRLGLADAWSLLDRNPGAAWSLVCLDLLEPKHARIKIYERLMGVDPAAIAARAGEDQWQWLRPFLEIMTGVKDLPWLVLVYPIRLSNGAVDQTIAHVPIDPAMPRDTVEDRVRRALEAYAIPAGAYLEALGAEAARLCHTYVSMQRIADRPRLTTYLAPRFFAARYGLFFRPDWPTPLASER